MSDDEDLKVKLALVLGMAAADLRVAIAIDLVRSLTGRRGGRPKETTSEPVTPEKQTGYLPTALQETGNASTRNHGSSTASPAVALPVGGLGGSLSGQTPAGSDPGPILSQPPISGDPQSDGRARRAKRLAEPVYPQQFEELWAGCDRQGDKATALKAWQEVGGPDPSIVVAAWAEWKRVAWFDGIGVPHVSTWLRRWAWKQKPAPRLTGGANRDAPLLWRRGMEMPK